MFDVLRRIPIFFIVGFLLVLAFTFVDYEWLFSIGARTAFVIIWALVGGFIQAMDSDLEFWGK
ncbi:hypothetical protein [Pseudomonas phage Astolliot]|nr:hypothetical protein [Pseudomonas phage Astolliot]